MSKRFTDTEKWRKGFIRSLQAPYKLLWLYITDECDHAGIWHVEIDVASVRIGESIGTDAALKAFSGRVIPFDGGLKWFIPGFISFQYGELNAGNRVHQSVIRQIKKYGLSKHLESPLEGAKDKDKDKEKEKAKGKAKDKDKIPIHLSLPGRIADELCDLMIAEMRLEKPDCVVNKTRAWISDMDKLLRTDGRTREQVERMIRWVTHDSFWAANVRSPSKLRKKFDALEQKMLSGSRESILTAGNQMRLTAAESQQQRNREALEAIEEREKR